MPKLFPSLFLRIRQGQRLFHQDCQRYCRLGRLKKAITNLRVARCIWSVSGSETDLNGILAWNQSFSDRQLKAMIHHWRVQLRKTGITRWPVYRKSDNAFVGMCGFSQNPDAGGVEVSLGIMPEFRGDPITKELYRAVLNHGFSKLRLDRIFWLSATGERSHQAF